MNGEATNLGVVRPAISRAEIVEVRKSGDGTPYAVFRVPIVKGDQNGSVQVADCRPETVEAARAALEVSEKFFKARRGEKKDLEDERVETLRHARATLNSGLAEAAIERKPTGGGKGELVRIGLFPTDADEAEAVLVLVHTRGRWSRYPTSGDERPLRMNRRLRGESKVFVPFFLHIIVTEPGRPISLWQLDENAPMLFTVSCEDGVSITHYHVRVDEEPAAERAPAAPSKPKKPTLSDLGLEDAEIEKLGKCKVKTVVGLTSRVQSTEDIKALAKEAGITYKRLREIVTVNELSG